MRLKELRKKKKITQLKLASDLNMNQNSVSRYENGEREADFINIVVWRGQAENCNKYLQKGSKCAVVGSLQTRSYDADDGSKRYVTEVVAESVEFIGNKKDGGTEEQPELTPIDDDKLPF